MSNIEWSPQQWLPQPKLSEREFERLRSEAMRGIFEAVTLMPDLADVVLEDFGVADEEDDSKELPYGTHGTLSKYFHIENGRSIGEKITLKARFPISVVVTRPTALSA